MAKRTAETISETVPNRMSGVRRFNAERASLVSAASVEGVSTKPGAIATARMPNGPSSLAHTVVSASTPAFAAAYADWPGFPRADIDEKFITTPRVR